MSDYYTIRLQQFNGDDGFTGGFDGSTQRDLRQLQAPSDLSQELTAAELRETRKSREEVILNVSPVISESRSASYADRGIQAPQGVVVYQSTGNRKFSISAKFVSRTIVEADLNFKNLFRIKSWMIPQSPTGNKGKPPILRLSGYKQQFSNIPVVLTNLTINFPDDVDYIEGKSGMMPIIQTVEMELLESHSISIAKFSTASVSDVNPRGLGQEFNLGDFQTGTLPGY